ncbi:KH domain-containing protein [Agrococcus jejuensis]|uniref:KH domain-containing protein n=1 Tax=Agrococcus jejuensis TaxID=399736 RepID=UPI0011A91768|nr:KH domain-containing protein [Agrococcus jejuensis]
MDVPVIAIALGALLLVVVAGLLLRGLRRRPSRARERVVALPSTTPVRLTTHARERMAQRGVLERDVALVARAPHRATPDAEEGSVALERDLDGDVLKVWVVAPWPPAAEVVVKSTAWQRVALGRIPRDAIGAVVGQGGATIQALERSTGARIAIDRATGEVRATASDRRTAEDALRQVEAVARCA